MESIVKLREYAPKSVPGVRSEILLLADEIEREIAERYMLKDDPKLEETAVQEYNLTVQVVAGQTIEYNTELRHRRGATTSMSVAFRLE